MCVRIQTPDASKRGRRAHGPCRKNTSSLFTPDSLSSACVDAKCFGLQHMYWLWHSAGSIPTTHGRTELRTAAVLQRNVLYLPVFSPTQATAGGSLRTAMLPLCLLPRPAAVRFVSKVEAGESVSSFARSAHSARDLRGGVLSFVMILPKISCHVFRSLEREGASPPPFHVLCQFLWSKNDNIKDMACVLLCTTEFCAKLCSSYVYMYQQIPKITLLSCPLFGERVRNVVTTSPRK